MAGGEKGKPGENLLVKKDGKIKKLPHRAVVNVKRGESIIIKTPGGRGFGEKRH